jgi:hypothetical protein
MGGRRRRKGNSGIFFRTFFLGGNNLLSLGRGSVSNLPVSRGLAENNWLQGAISYKRGLDVPWLVFLAELAC